MGVLDYFIGTAQSKYAAIAMFSAILVICLAILLTVSDISIGNRIGLVLFVILMSLFPVMISLFELTCIVTGGRNNKYNLCSIFAWFVTIVVVIYCFILIITTLISMFTYKKAIHKITITENFNKISNEDADTIAKNILEDENIKYDTNSIENFYLDKKQQDKHHLEREKHHLEREKQHLERQKQHHLEHEKRHLEHEKNHKGNEHFYLDKKQQDKQHLEREKQHLEREKQHLERQKQHHLEREKRHLEHEKKIQKNNKGKEHFSYEMPSLSPMINNLFSNQEGFENEVTGIDESSNYMDLEDIKQTINQVPVKQNLQTNEIETIEPFSNTVENFYSI